MNLDNVQLKDCLYGQVRPLHLEVGQYKGRYEDALCTTLPNDVGKVITKQNIVTWNDATGMNPLHNWANVFSDNASISKFSYGDMLVEAYNIGGVCVTELTDGPIDALRYEKLIRRDYTNQYTAACKRLACWYLTHQLLSAPDILDYDYVLLRQIDTLIQPHITRKFVTTKLEECTRALFNKKLPSPDVPIMYEMSGDHDFIKVPIATYIPSYAYMFNRSAIKILKDNFFRTALAECDHYYKTIGQDNLTMGLPGVIMMKLTIKNNIEVIRMKSFLDDPINVRGTPALQDDYARLDRIRK